MFEASACKEVQLSDWFRVSGSGFKVQGFGLGFRVSGIGFKV